jgi:hypothetical protein
LLTGSVGGLRLSVLALLGAALLHIASLVRRALSSPVAR